MAVVGVRFSAREAGARRGAAPSEWSPRQAAEQAAETAADGAGRAGPSERVGAAEAEVVRACLAQARLLEKESYPRYCAISARWWRQWGRWSGFDPSEAEEAALSEEEEEALAEGHAEERAAREGWPRPGAFRNAELVERSANMNDLEQGRDYVWVPEEVWHALRTWYAVDCEPVTRTLNSRSALRRALSALPGSPSSGGAGDSRKRRSSSIYEECDLPSAPSYWDLSWDGAEGGAPGRCAVCRGKSATKACKRCGLPYCGRDCQASHWRFHKAACARATPPAAPPRHVTPLGLNNLGNTCYMNATVQCLAHCWPLTRYLISGRYRADRNVESKLGTGGRFAAVWEHLLRELWLGGEDPLEQQPPQQPPQQDDDEKSAAAAAAEAAARARGAAGRRCTSLSPAAFKRAIATLPGSGNQFAGFLQHDAQELLVFLLDTLHEDLNLVLKKPYFAHDDDGAAGNKSIARLAAESWASHMRREHSMVTHLLQGQLHNTVLCPHCKYRSNTFSPFMFLPLALPVDVDRVVFITLVRILPANISGAAAPLCASQTRFAISVGPHSRCRAVKQRLAELSGSPASALWLVDLRNGLIADEFLDGEPVSKILPRHSLVAYELGAPDLLFQPPANDTAVSVDLREVVVTHRAQPSIAYQQQQQQQQQQQSEQAGEGDFEDEDEEGGGGLRRAASNNAVGVPLVLRFDAARVSFARLRTGILRVLLLLATGEDPVSQLGTDWEAALAPRARALQLSCTDYMGLDQVEEKSNGADPPAHVVPDGEQLVQAGPTGIATRRTIFLAAQWPAPEEQEPLEPRLGAYRESRAFSVRDDASSVRHMERLRRRRALEQRHHGESYTIHECLNYFSNVEQLGAGNSWTCPRCRTDQQAYKMMSIIRLPEVLILSLKRFEARASFGMRSKITAYVDFPVEGLDLAPYLAAFGGDLEQADTVFDLFAVTNHHGTLGYGHYTSMALHEGQWYNFDDATVQPMRKEDVQSSAAYVLYYKRRHDTPQPQPR